jgi:hypothetical protein
MLSVAKQMEILAQLSLQYQDFLQDEDGWREFFRRNDLSIPFSTLYYLKMVNYSIEPSRRIQMNTLIKQTYIELCEELNLDKDEKYLSVQDMMRRSPNPSIPIFDDETKEIIEAL